MREILSTVTSRGQVTIPAEVRRYLGLKQRDKVAFVIRPEGHVILKTPTFPTIQSLRGIAGTLEQPLSWEEVKRIAREDALLQRYHS